MASEPQDTAIEQAFLYPADALHAAYNNGYEAGVRLMDDECARLRAEVARLQAERDEARRLAGIEMREAAGQRNLTARERERADQAEAALKLAEARGREAGLREAAALPHYNCDCLNADPQTGAPTDNEDGIYTERWVVLLSDIEALAGQGA